MKFYLDTMDSRKSHEIKEKLYHFFLEFGFHDQFLWTLWDENSPWQRDLSKKLKGGVHVFLERYRKARAKFWLREHRQDAGDLELVPVSYTKLPENLLPTIAALWELEEMITQLMVLGKVITAKI